MSEVNEVKCSGSPDCPEVFRSTEPFSKDVTFTCRNHTGKAPDKVRLQAHSHDPKLATAHDPIAYLKERN